MYVLVHKSPKEICLEEFPCHCFITQAVSMPLALSPQANMASPHIAITIVRSFRLGLDMTAQNFS